MLTCACILTNTLCWLLSTGILRLISFITSTRKVLNKHLLTARVQEVQWAVLTEMNLGTSPGGTGGKFQQRTFLGCVLLPLSSSVSVLCAHRLLLQPGSPGAVQGRMWLWGHCRAEASKSKSCKTLPEQTAAFGAAKAPQLLTHVHVTDCCSELPYKEVGALWELLL